MRKITLLAVLFLPFLLKANFSVKDSTLKEGEMDSTKIKFLSYDKNIDSLVSTLYSQPPTTDNPFMLAEADSAMLFADRPDSFYIQRLKKIPSLISLTYNNVVKRYIEVYTVKKRDKLEEILSLKEYYFPIFEEILDRYDMPLELKYLAVIESALNPRAVSRAGATGIWQFMLGTGKLYKLNINSFVDERRDPVLETHAAARFLKDLYTIYGDWILVIAAYNCGPGNVNKAIRRSGGKTNYWEIYSYLPRETRGYVPAFIAATYAINYYKDHNLKPSPVDLPPYSDTVIVRENVHLQQIADIMKLPIQLVRDLNPQYRRDIIPGKYSACPLRLPAMFITRYIDYQDSILKYKNAEFFAGEFKIINPQGRYGGYSPKPPVGNMKKIYHMVETGQTLGEISAKYRVSIADLRYWNDIAGNKIRAGRNLVIYLPKKSAEKLEAQGAKTVKNAGNEQTNSEYIYYEVKSGDTIWKIASLYQGVTGEDLMKWNNLASGKIHPGQQIKIKKLN